MVLSFVGPHRDFFMGVKPVGAKADINLIASLIPELRLYGVRGDGLYGEEGTGRCLSSGVHLRTRG